MQEYTDIFIIELSRKNIFEPVIKTTMDDNSRNQ